MYSQNISLAPYQQTYPYNNGWANQMQPWGYTPYPQTFQTSSFPNPLSQNTLYSANPANPLDSQYMAKTEVQPKNDWSSLTIFTAVASLVALSGIAIKFFKKKPQNNGESNVSKTTPINNPPDNNAPTSTPEPHAQPPKTTIIEPKSVTGEEIVLNPTGQSSIPLVDSKNKYWQADYKSDLMLTQANRAKGLKYFINYYSDSKIQVADETIRLVASKLVGIGHYQLQELCQDIVKSCPSGKKQLDEEDMRHFNQDGLQSKKMDLLRSQEKAFLYLSNLSDPKKPTEKERYELLKLGLENSEFSNHDYKKLIDKTKDWTATDLILLARYSRIWTNNQHLKSGNIYNPPPKLTPEAVLSCIEAQNKL